MQSKKARNLSIAGFYILVRLAGIEPTTPWFVAIFSIIQKNPTTSIYLIKSTSYEFTSFSKIHHNPVNAQVFSDTVRTRWHFTRPLGTDDG